MLLLVYDIDYKWQNLTCIIYLVLNLNNFIIYASIFTFYIARVIGIHR